nr:radical SAM protein [Candidatus Enterousia merdequi]
MIKLLESLKEDARLAGTVKYLAKYAPYFLIFKTTNYCWYKCAHCCEKAGPDNEKIYIPQETIINILKQAKQDKKFVNEVVFTGGEIFSAYKFGDKQYIPNILNFSLQNNIGVDIKTNAGWANTTFGKEIFDDLRKVITDNKPRNLELPKLQISLSLDKYHTNCFDNNFKIIQELAGLPVIIHLSSFMGQEYLIQDFEKQLQSKFNTEKLFSMGSLEPSDLLIENETLFTHSFGRLFDGGRATKLSDAFHIEYPQFSFIQKSIKNPVKLVAFDSFGRVTLGENSGRKIMTPYIDEYKQIKSLSKIFQDLNNETSKEVLYFLCYDRLFKTYTK